MNKEETISALVEAHRRGEAVAFEVSEGLTEGERRSAVHFVIPFEWLADVDAALDSHIRGDASPRRSAKLSAPERHELNRRSYRERIARMKDGPLKRYVIAMDSASQGKRAEITRAFADEIEETHPARVETILGKGPKPQLVDEATFGHFYALPIVAEGVVLWLFTDREKADRFRAAWPSRLKEG